MAESGFTVADLNPALLIGSLVLLAAAAAVRLSVRSGMPSLIIYLVFGMVLGESGLGIRFDDELLTQALGYAALALILIEGGLTTRWSTIRGSMGPAVSLATVGIIISVLVVAGAAHLLLDVPWEIALIIGAVLASTDSAAVFSVLRTVSLPKRLSGLLEAESGFNDAPVVILVVAFAANAARPDESLSVLELALGTVLQLIGGVVLGLAVGWLGVRVLRRIASTSSGLFAIAVFAVAVFAYAAAASLNVSGFIACYLAALVMGNAGLPHQQSVGAFGTAVGWLAQIGLFVLLGLLASPANLVEQIVPAIVVGGVLLLLARPLSVVISVLPFRLPWREQAFLSWAGLRGAVPIVVATVPITYGLATEWMFDLVFVLVVALTLIQAPTLPWVARRLKVTESYQSLSLGVELVPLEEMDADLLLVSVGPGSRIAGVEVGELRLPPGSNVTLIIRDKAGFVPTPATSILRGDELLIVTTTRARDAAERRVRAVSEEGRLAGWAAKRWQRRPRGDSGE
ncbi:MAG: potassium/proton antiporter [Dermatophilaceae bacterium]